MKEQFKVMLAPMAGVTDMPFRLLCRRMGCELAFTEMISAKGMHYNNARTEELLRTAEEELPVGVQLFGSEPPMLAHIAGEIEERYGDSIAVIDINMGCPVHKIVKNGEGSALMKTPVLAGDIMWAVAKSVKLPVTVKFRSGWDESTINAVEFARVAEENGAAALCVHGRTRTQMYSGKADWEIIARVKQAVKIPVWGNGDLYTAGDVLRMRRETGCDGVLIARGALGNPFLFREIQAALRGGSCPAPTVAERIDLAMTHARLQADCYGAHGIVQLRKHIAWYVHGMKGAVALRAAINGVKTLEEVEALLEGLL